MSLIHYLLEANLYLVAFYLLYVLLLRSETLYQLNRAYLLLTSILAFIIPLLQVGLLRPTPVLAPIAAVTSLTPAISVGSLNPADIVVTPLPQFVEPTTTQLTITDYVLITYGVIAAALLLHLVIKIVKLLVLSKKGIVTKSNGFTLIEMPGSNVAFSFFGYLFVSSELLSSPTILHHEQVHIRQRHSIDIVYFELMGVVNWFNPIVYLMRKSIKEVHEFIADKHAASVENNTSTYADFLISNAYGLSPIHLTNSFFNKSLLKRRIIMLYQKKSGTAARLKYLLTLPLAAGLICASTMAFTNKTYGWIDLDPAKIVAGAQSHTLNPYTTIQKDPAMDIVEHENPAVAIDNIAQQPDNTIPLASANTPNIIPARADTTVYHQVETLPAFPGGNTAFGEFLRNNVHYPKADKDANIQGRVFVQFVIEMDGTLTGLKILRTPSQTLGAEAVRVLSASPKWTAGMNNGTAVRTLFTVPVNFALDNNSGITLSPPPDAAVQKFDTVKTAQTTGGTVYSAVEIQPTFPGGQKAFGEFLSKNIRYPKAAHDAGVTGRVFAQFVVEIDGSLADIKILRDPGSGLGDEALRVLNLSPKWTPGVQNGRPVRVLFTVPINFALNNDDIFKPFYMQVRNTLRYPREAKERNIQGRVFVSFTLNDDNKVQEPTVIRAPDKLLGDEVVKVLTGVKFASGKTNVSYMLPVSFTIATGNDKLETKDTENGVKISNPYHPTTSEKVNLNEIAVIAYPTVH